MRSSKQLLLCGLRLKFAFLMELRPGAKWWGHQLSLIQEMAYQLLSAVAVGPEGEGEGEVGLEGKVVGELVGWCWLA
jgi:hypothetical protein